MSKVANKHAGKRSNIQEKGEKEVFKKYVPGWSFTDLDIQSNFILLMVFRLLCALLRSHNSVHPDEFWQVTQVAYNWVYGGVNLPWEFKSQYRLRNVLYPAYIAAPMYFVKLLGLDSPTVVYYLPYMAQLLLAILNDHFIWKVGKKTVGVDGTRIGVLLIVMNHFQIEYITRCFGNSLEQILSVIAFYYYLKQKDRFTMDTVILTATITVAFIGRNTSIVGWIPLLAIKVLREGSLPPFLLSALTVAIPCMAFMVYVDTLYYDSDDWTVTSVNFLKVNILEGLSKFFGEDPWYMYVIGHAFGLFTVVYPFLLYAITVGHADISWSKN